MKNFIPGINAGAFLYKLGVSYRDYGRITVKGNPRQTYGHYFKCDSLNADQIKQITDSCGNAHIKVIGSEYAPELKKHAIVFLTRAQLQRNEWANRLPVRSDVHEIEYHRPPTKAEVNFGHGAIHYRVFPLSECCHAETRVLKAWFVADDGLRYYR